MYILFFILNYVLFKEEGDEYREKVDGKRR